MLKSIQVLAAAVLLASPVLAQNNTYGGSLLRPTNVIQGRLVKFGGQFDF